MVTPEYFLEKAKQCFDLATKDREVAEALEAMGHEFMMKAAELRKRPLEPIELK